MARNRRGLGYQRVKTLLTRYDRDHVQLRRVITTGTSNAIHIGRDDLNTLAIVANGETFNLYINYTLIGHYTDTAYVDGQIGLIVHTCHIIYPDSRPNLCDAPTEAVFSRITVWKI